MILNGHIPPLGDFVFLNRSADDNMPIVALHSREEVRHVAFEVDSLAALKALYRVAKANGTAISHAMNHRVSLSMYFRDPAGNLLEAFWPSGQPSQRPYADLIASDTFERPDEEIMQLVGVAT